MYMIVKIVIYFKIKKKEESDIYKKSCMYLQFPVSGIAWIWVLPGTVDLPSVIFSFGVK